MAELSYSVQSGLPSRPTDWRSIWAGAFIFYGIWAVFGALGMAIFASNANPNAGAPVMGQSVGMTIWAVVLTIIAMYVAGHETSRLAGVRTRHEGLLHGLTMFGLSIVGLVVLVAVAGIAITQGNVAATNSHSPFALTVAADLGWGGFIALFLGWLAAILGASSVAPPRVEREVREIRPAA